MTEPISDTDSADSARTIAEHLAAHPDEITEVIRLAAEAGDARLHTVLASLAAVLEDRTRLETALTEALAERDQARAELDAMETEWSAGHPYDDGRPGLCMHGNQGEHNARQMAGNGDGWQAMRRLVGGWQPADGSET